MPSLDILADNFQRVALALHSLLLCYIEQLFRTSWN